MVPSTLGILCAGIDPGGAEMESLPAGGVEMLRHDARDAWQSVAPVLFPICGGLKDDTFYHNGRAYKLPKHGFASLRTFEAVKTAENAACFTLRPQPGDEAMYPWD